MLFCQNERPLPSINQIIHYYLGSHQMKELNQRILVYTVYNQLCCPHQADTSHSVHPQIPYDSCSKYHSQENTLVNDHCMSTVHMS